MPESHIGLYPGTFDPMHNGHLDVIDRAVRLVDHLVVGVAINTGKGPLFPFGRTRRIGEIGDFRHR